MTIPEPSPPDPKPLLTTLIDAFKGFLPILSFDGPITVPPFVDDDGLHSS